jgi:hypothetical protein
VAELNRVLDLIAEHPERSPEYRANTRRPQLRRFPYRVLYRVRPEVVEVIAVAHIVADPDIGCGESRPGIKRPREHSPTSIADSTRLTAKTQRLNDRTNRFPAPKTEKASRQVSGTPRLSVELNGIEPSAS